MDSPEAAVERRIADTLWSQWRAFGVQTGGARAAQVIDPEVLLIESAIVAARIDDPRVADAAIAWAVRHHPLVITARLKSVLKRYDEADRVAFGVLSRRVIDIAGRLAWPAAATASPWQVSVDVRLPRLDGRPELIRLRTRALFGANARAEAMAFLMSAGAAGADLAAVERATAFSKRHLAAPLEQIALEGSVECWWLGNRRQYRLSDGARGYLGFPRGSLPAAAMPEGGGSGGEEARVAAALPWVDWHSRFRLARVIGDASAQIHGPGGVVAAVGRIRAGADLLQRHGVQPPAPLDPGRNPAERADNLAGWAERTVATLLTA